MKKNSVLLCVFALLMAALLCVGVGAETENVGVVTEVTDADIGVVSYQVTKGENGEFSLRVIAGLNSLCYKNFGYEITVTEGGTPKTLSGTDDKVYESIYGGNTEYSIKDNFGYEYAALATVTGLAQDSENTTLEIRVFVVMLDGEVSYGKGATFLYEGALDANGYPFLRMECASHTYDNDCDASCNVCGHERTTTHSYDTEWSTDGANHWYECSVCGDKKDMQAHSYDNDNDATCNACGYVRQVKEFLYSGTCGADGDNLIWGLTTDGELVISGTGDMKNYTSASSIPWYSHRYYSITKVIIEDGVTSIGDKAFYECYSLTSVTIPDSVTSIGKSAFIYCSSLTSVTIPEGVKSIGYFAFGECSNLISVTIPDSMTSIGSEAFYDCTSLTSIDIPGSVTSIGDMMFWMCSNLTSVTIGEGVTSIESYAFEGTGLTSIDIPDSVTSIGYYAFGCPLTSVTIPENVTNIEEGAFACTNALKSVTILSKTVSIHPNEGTISSSATIYGYAGSTAQAYATLNGRTFVALDE